MKKNKSNIITSKSKIMLITLIIISLIVVLFFSIGNQPQKNILDTIVKEEKKVALQVYQQTFFNFIDKYELLASNLLINGEIFNASDELDAFLALRKIIATINTNTFYTDI